MSITTRLSRKSLRGLALALALGVVAGCAPMVRYHGFAPDARDLAGLQVGQTSREAVIARFGPPTSDGGVTSDTLYYVANKFRIIGPFAPRETERTVLALDFDGSDRLRNVTRYGLADGRVVALERRVTDDGIADVGVLGQLLGAFGRIDAGTLLGETGDGL